MDRRPPRLVRTKGAVAFLHPCSVCGKPDAPFGVGVRMLKDDLGKWTCGPRGCIAPLAKTEQSNLF